MEVLNSVSNTFGTVSRAFSYEEFVSFTAHLVESGKTTGPDQSPEMLEYTKLNLQRMRRWEKTFKADEALAVQIKNAAPQIWWVITEPWCGDSAQIITQLAAIAQASEGAITLKIILRDENLSVMDQYLTNNSRSVPKLVSVNESGEELFNWGPRPEKAQYIVTNWKKKPEGKTYDELKTEIHLWYTKDKGQSLQREIAEKLQLVF